MVISGLFNIIIRKSFIFCISLLFSIIAFSQVPFSEETSTFTSKASSVFSEQRSLKGHLIVKTSPFDFMIGRFLLATEYGFQGRKSVELTLFTDYMRFTDPFAGESDFGRMYYLNARYKLFYGQKRIYSKRQNKANGFYTAFGLSTGITPLLDASVPTALAFVPDLQKEKSTFVGLGGDLGYAYSFKKIYIESFLGLEYTRHARSTLRTFDNQGQVILTEFMPLFLPRIRFGIRVGYYIW